MRSVAALTLWHHLGAFLLVVTVLWAVRCAVRRRWIWVAAVVVPFVAVAAWIGLVWVTSEWGSGFFDQAAWIFLASCVPVVWTAAVAPWLASGETRRPRSGARHRRTQHSGEMRSSILGLWRPLVIATAVAISSCGGSHSTESPATSPLSTTTTSTTTTTSSTVTPAVPIAGDLPSLLVAHDGGIDLWTTQVGSTPLLTGRSVAAAVPDLQGGIVFQGPQDEFGRASAIEWLPTQGNEPVTVVDPDRALILTLVQVANVDAAPTIVYRKWVELPNDCPDQDLECRWDHHYEYLVTRGLLGGAERNLGGIGSFESDTLGFSLGGDRVGFAVNRYEEGACAGWVLLSAVIEASSDGWIGEGSELDEACATGPTPWCPAGERCDGEARVAVSPDGTLIAYAFSEWRPETGEHLAPIVVIHDPAAGAETLRVEVGGPGVQPTWIDFDGRFVLLGRADI